VADFSAGLLAKRTAKNLQAITCLPGSLFIAVTILERNKWAKFHFENSLFL
jgi:hypothetical protein